MALTDVVLVGTSQVAVSLIGVAVGALLALLSSIGVESRRNRQQLVGAIEVVITELDENQKRLRTKQNLTLGDWEQNKETLSQLAVKRPRLWETLARTYGKVYESKRWLEQESSPAPPTLKDLTDLTNDLESYAAESVVKRIVYVATLQRRSDRVGIKRERRERLASSAGGTAPNRGSG